MVQRGDCGCVGHGDYCQRSGDENGLAALSAAGLYGPANFAQINFTVGQRSTSHCKAEKHCGTELVFSSAVCLKCASFTNF